MRRCLLALGLLSACSSDLPADLGEHPADRVNLLDTHALAHLPAAMDDPGSLTVEDLFRRRPGYVQAPEPWSWFFRLNVNHDALPPLPSFVPLRVLSFNTGLLDRWYPFTVIQVPEVDIRRERMAVELLSDGWDVLILQEVWDERDVRTFVREAQETGYLHYSGSADAHEGHGLLMLVREDLIDPDGPDDRSESIFELQRDIERFPGPGIDRGFLEWSFRHAPTGTMVHLFDTHTTAFVDLASIRDAQARELGLAVREVPDDELVIVGCDFNGGAYYPKDEFGEVDGEPVRGWWRNAQAYPLVQYYGELEDTLAVTGPPPDIELLEGLPEFGPAYKREPFGDDSLCEGMAGAFTASDCNSLYFEQYAATEYPARIDFIFYRDVDARARVLQTAIEYVEPLSGESFELSDHYGVSATLLISDQ